MEIELDVALLGKYVMTIACCVIYVRQLARLDDPSPGHKK